MGGDSPSAGSVAGRKAPGDRARPRRPAGAPCPSSGRASSASARNTFNQLQRQLRNAVTSARATTSVIGWSRDGPNRAQRRATRSAALAFFWLLGPRMFLHSGPHICHLSGMVYLLRRHGAQVSPIWMNASVHLSSRVSALLGVTVFCCLAFVIFGSPVDILIAGFGVHD